MVKIFIGGFPLNTSELELVMLVSPYGAVDTIKIVRDKKTGICKGYAFLEMKDLEGAKNVKLALDGTMLKEKALTINVMEERPVEPVYAPPLPPKPAAERFSYRIERPLEPAKKKRPRK